MELFINHNFEALNAVGLTTYEALFGQYLALGRNRGAFFSFFIAEVQLTIDPGMQDTLVAYFDETYRQTSKFFDPDRPVEPTEKCRAIKRDGKPCRQTKDLIEGYCQYHQAPKYRSASHPA